MIGLQSKINNCGVNTPKDRLFRLVKSMTPSEKRYFKKHYANGPNAITTLFDKLNTLEHYNEDNLKEILPENISANLKVFKVKLQERLLKSLSSNFSKKTVISKIRNGLEEVDLLMTKQLYDIASEQLIKIKKLAEKYEEHTYLIEIAYLELRLHSLSLDKRGISKHPIMNALSTYAKALDQQIFFTQLGYQVVDHQKQSYYRPATDGERDDFEKELDAVEDRYPAELLTFKSSLSFNITKSIIYKKLDRTEDAYHYRKLNVDLFNQNPHFKATLSFSYLAVLRNFISFCMDTFRYDEMENVIQEAKVFIQKETPHERPQLIYFYFSELKMIFERNQYHKIVDHYLPIVEDFIHTHHIATTWIATFSYIFFLVSDLVLANYQRAIHFLQLINRTDSDIKKNNLYFFLLLELIVHHEAEDFHSVQHLIQRIKRKFKLSSMPASFFKEVISWLDTITNHPELAKQACIDLEQLIEDQYKSDEVYDLMVYYKLDFWWKAVQQNRKLKNVIGVVSS